MAFVVARRRSCRWAAAILAAFVLAAGQYPSPRLCAFVLVESIDDIVNTAYDIMQAAQDCSLPHMAEAPCASDLTDMMNRWFRMSSDLCSATLFCGGLDNECGASISMALRELARASTDLIAAASDCSSDRSVLTCTFDVVSAIDRVNRFIGNIIAAFSLCNELEHVPGVADWWRFGFTGTFTRRLAEHAEELPAPFSDQRREVNDSLELLVVRTQARATLNRIFDLIESRGEDVSVERQRADSMPDLPVWGLAAASAQLRKVHEQLGAVLKEAAAISLVLTRSLIP